MEGILHSRSAKIAKFEQTGKEAINITEYLFNSTGGEHTWFLTHETENLNVRTDKNILLKNSLIKAYNLNQIFHSVRKQLNEVQLFAFKVETAENIKVSYKEKIHPLSFKVVYLFHFIFCRVLPKLKGFRKVCRLLNVPVDLSKSEVLGRLIYCGFIIEKVIEQDYETLFVARKNLQLNPSETDQQPKEGFLFKMKRLGINNKEIFVYKFRSMHPYAEYVQEFLHKEKGLDSTGKFKDDFRVSTGGRVIRKYWIDELPMLVNLLKGDIKIVGVRPISQHYFSLYPDNLKTERQKLKPGLLPPYYADLPKSFDEIVASELKYIKACEANPFKTDVRYFLQILNNILIKKARSK
jgi:lipopolysaccharide/colanic/teichoic acid biosynthesis glycosyltransferase